MKLALCAVRVPARACGRHAPCRELHERIAKLPDRGDGGVCGDTDRTCERFSKFRDRFRKAVRLCGDIGSDDGEFAGHRLKTGDC